ncbi:MAG: DUF255 domain-containing protein [Flavobacteriales bacterium]|nr:DUF255 domain-containing protein [Flavobacteriales bacterium]
MIKFYLILGFLFVSNSSFSQQEKIEWLSFEEAVKRNETKPKKFIVDVYTSWCGWCKRMDANTFTNPVIIGYIKDNYWAVKLNAERKDTVVLGSQTFINENLDARRGPHQLAIALLNGKMTYPSIVYLDEQVELMHPAIAGYQDPNSLEQIIKYFGEEAYQSIPWDKYQKEFESEINLK